MKDLSEYLDDAYLLFSSSPMNCCFPHGQQASRKGPKDVIERPMRMELDQPHLVPPPLFASPISLERPPTRGREWISQTKSFASRASSRGSFSVRRKLNIYNGPRRPRIGAPSDFRLVEESSFSSPKRTVQFRPLELSIFAPENRLSALLPYFESDISQYGKDARASPQPPVAVLHSRSESGSSFQIPRKPVRTSSDYSLDWTTQFKSRPETISANELLAAQENPLPILPPAAHLKTMTESPSYERLRSAIHEKFELEHRLRDIEELIEERKSIYLSSRPTSRAGSQADSIKPPAEEPLPPLPLKMNKTTAFTSAEAIVQRPATPHSITRAPLPFVDQRPKTAPPRTVLIPTRLKTFTEASSNFTSSLPSSANTPSDYSPVPPPPLPLVLQAPRPLRKRKSFSRVSNWLFPASTSSSEHTREISLDSITNSPRPVTSRDGFYRCVDINHSTRMSTTSASTITTLESELGEPSPSLPTMYSQQSSPGKRPEKRDVAIRDMSMDSERNEKSVELTRTRTFGEKELDNEPAWRVQVVPQRTSVGIAF